MLRKWLVLSLIMGLAACAAPPKGTVKPRTQPATSPPSTRQTPKPPPPAPSSGNQPAVVKIAESFLGTPYRYGGSTRKGIDCSGLVVRVYSEAGVQMPRTSASQFRVGESILKAQLRAGDLVFFGNSSNRISHVGIYAGGGKFIHASSNKRKVRYDSMGTTYFVQRYLGARRVVESAR